MRLWNWIDSAWNSLRFALRTLRKSPGFTVIAVASLALGIGANTAVFTLLDQLVLRLLPVKEPQQLVMLWPSGPHLGNNNGNRKTSYPMYQDFQQRAEAFESVFCQYDTAVAVRIDVTTERANAELVSGNYFQALQVGAARGRVFSPAADDRLYMGHPSVVLSYRYWMNRFGGDTGIIGRKVLVNNYPMTVVGVAAAGFTGLDPSQSPHLWVPIQMRPVMDPNHDDLGNRRSQWVQVFARLKHGYSIATAHASLQPLLHQILRQEVAEPALAQVSQYNRNLFLQRDVFVETAANGFSELRQQYQTALVALLCMAGLILLIACFNVANLLIARASARRKEIAVRLSLGAARSTLIGQLLVESLLLSVAGAAIGLLLSGVTTRLLLGMLPASDSLVMLSPEPDQRILLFSVAVALLTSLLFGLAPALQSIQVDLFSTLRGVSSAVAGTQSAVRFRRVLVVAQVALSFLLLAGAGLFVRTLLNLKDADGSFHQIDHLLSFQVDPSENGYTMSETRQYYEKLLGGILVVPGVQSATYAMNPILSGWESDGYMAVEGHQAKDGEDMQAPWNAVAPGYWQTMGIRLLAGRDFDKRDRSDNTDMRREPTVAIVNHKFAQHFFGTRSPIGRHISFGNPRDGKLTTEIVGMVGDSLYESPRVGIHRQVFFSYLEVPMPHSVSFYIRTSNAPAEIIPQIRKAAQRLDGAMPIYQLKTLDRQLDETLSTERLIALLSVAFGGLATLMAALGLYGVMAFLVTARTKEIGLRMALGARQGPVLWLVFREMLALLVAGFAIGIPCSYLLSRSVSSQLFGVAPTDLLTGLAAVGILGMVATISAFVPARRASTIDPMTALRYE